MAFHSAVVWRARAVVTASWSSRERRVMWRRFPLVHKVFAGQGPQSVVAQDTTIASVSRWVQSVHEELGTPWGQVAVRVAKSKVKAALPYPAPARAWAEWSRRTGVTRVRPCRLAARTMMSADG